MAIVRLDRSGKLKNSVTSTRIEVACSTVLHSTSLLRAPYLGVDIRRTWNIELDNNEVEC
jgi:hypothetical protein